MYFISDFFQELLLKGSGFLCCCLGNAEGLWREAGSENDVGTAKGLMYASYIRTSGQSAPGVQ
ncbi:hypothetical protein EIM92_05195 [Paenibacillus lentus]|uniref:Uncharacterized protein n=1 Tax=Paenibacillus lentus TaxID=1338368 RepID=A0A3S8RRU3_9BACL|nr:hypothetical protein EIM92_05195 [Paenibacillus lentus]